MMISLAATALMAACATASLTTDSPPSPDPISSDLPTLTNPPMDDNTPTTPSPSGTYAQPIWDHAAQTAAATHAEATIIAYLDNADPATWWNTLSPYLTQQAQDTYADVNPTTIIPATVTAGSATMISPMDDQHLRTALVQVSTSGGVFGLVLYRESSNNWLTAQIVLPGYPVPEEVRVNS